MTGAYLTSCIFPRHACFQLSSWFMKERRARPTDMCKLLSLIKHEKRKCCCESENAGLNISSSVTDE